MTGATLPLQPGLNVSAIIANISVLAIFASLVAAGIMRGLKEVRDFRKPASPSNVNAQVAAATILENVTLSEWTRSNQLVCDQLARVVDALNRDREERLEGRGETTRLSAATVRLRDEIEELRRDLANDKRRRGGT